MLSTDILLAFSLSALVLSLSPGPSNLYIMACTMGSGAKSGVAAAGGMALGSLTYVLLTALGLAAVVVYTPIVFVAIKLLGAAYLLYLGYKTIRTAHAPHLRKAVKAGPRKVYLQSIIVELTNPKTALFFLAFLPQFTRPEQGDVVYQLLLLGVIYSFIAFCSDITVVALSRKLGQLLAKSPKLAVRQEQFAGAILVCLGLLILGEESAELLEA